DESAGGRDDVRRILGAREADRALADEAERRAAIAADEQTERRAHEHGVLFAAEHDRARRGEASVRARDGGKSEQHEDERDAPQHAACLSGGRKKRTTAASGSPPPPNPHSRGENGIGAGWISGDPPLHFYEEARS